MLWVVLSSYCLQWKMICEMLFHLKHKCLYPSRWICRPCWECQGSLCSYRRGPVSREPGGGPAARSSAVSGHPRADCSHLSTINFNQRCPLFWALQSDWRLIPVNTFGYNTLSSRWGGVVTGRYQEGCRHFLFFSGTQACPAFPPVLLLSLPRSSLPTLLSSFPPSSLFKKSTHPFLHTPIHSKSLFKIISCKIPWNRNFCR